MSPIGFQKKESWMDQRPDVPEKLRLTYRRLLHRLPPELRDDERQLNTLLVYLKIGGERMARHFIELSRVAFQGKIVFMKKPPEPAEPEAEAAPAAASDDTPEEQAPKEEAQGSREEAQESEEIAADKTDAGEA
jgi:hypothetical protein